MMVKGNRLSFFILNKNLNLYFITIEIKNQSFIEQQV